MLRRRRPLILLGTIGLLAVLAAALSARFLIPSPPAVSSTLFADNPALEDGTPLQGEAPDFTLTDQFGRQVALHSFRGRVVMLAFDDSECTTICPLTTTEMVDAKRLLGSAGAQVQLLGIDANPQATAVANVLAYSELHGMMREWHFLTGSLAQLQHVWQEYGIAVQIENGLIDHTPALYIIDQQGRLVRLYLTQMAYAAIGQQAQILAQEVSSLLPGHPHVLSSLPYDPVATISPATGVALPRAGGGTVDLGPGTPRLALFFATWDAEVTDLAPQLKALNQYVSMAQRDGLPALTAIDEESVEPSSSALPSFLSSLGNPLRYPVAIDRTGQLADGYAVGDEPWLVLTSTVGKILWHLDVSTSGWLTPAALARKVSSVLAASSAPPSPALSQAALAGSPVALAALHDQAGQLLSGGFASLEARIHALRGYSIVINAWASWCTPCRAEFPLLASASLRYGRQVAFLGVDIEDLTGGAKAFLADHPVSYPSYPTSLSALSSLADVVGAPTTIFISAGGKVVDVHPGQYDSQAALDSDIAIYALAG
jgi:cytochrome c biogenesis protein CcmG/thiol:disulfide interchange protein DsbE